LVFMAIYMPQVLSFQGQLVNAKNQLASLMLKQTLDLKTKNCCVVVEDLLIGQTTKMIEILQHLLLTQKQTFLDGHIITMIIPWGERNCYHLPVPYNACLKPVGGVFIEFQTKLLYKYDDNRGCFVGIPHSGPTSAW
jgi:hypothetical protein